MEPAASRNGRSTQRPARAALFWLGVIVFAAIGYRSVLPPAPLPSDVPAERFSAERAFTHIERIAQSPHPMGSPALREVRSYLIEQLDQMGIEAQTQAITARDYFGDTGSVEVVNIVGRIHGTDGSAAIALMAHYDTVPATPGANDNTAAVATLLETGRALLAGPPLQYDVLLLFTDGEEPAPRYGATAFVTEYPAFADIALVVNLEAIGGSGASILAETSGPERWLTDGLAAADSHPAAFSFATAMSRLLGDIGTDFDAFRNAGVNGFHFAYLHGSPIYHTAADNLDAVNRGSLQHHGDHALGIAQHFGGIDLSDPPNGEAVFFTIRPLFVIYSTVWVVPLALLVVGLTLAATAQRVRQRAAGVVGLMRSIGKTLAVGLLATLGATAAWIGLTAARSTPGVVESSLYYLGILAAAIYVIGRLAGNRPAFHTGIVLIWATFAVLTALVAPGFSYIFAWPALAAAIAALWRPDVDGIGRMFRFLLVAAPTLLLVTPAVDVLVQFSQPRPGNPDSEMAAAIAAPILLGLLAAGLISTVWTDSDQPAVVAADWDRTRKPGPHR